jgi:excisionase family DNA binding protein
MPNKSPQFISVSEVAEATGLHPVSIRRLVASGSIPSVKLGGRRLITAEWLSNLEASSREGKAAIASGGAV